MHASYGIAPGVALRISGVPRSATPRRFAARAPVFTVMLTVLSAIAIIASDGKLPVWIALCPITAALTYVEPLCAFIAPLAFMIICGTNFFGSVTVFNVHLNATDWLFCGALTGLVLRLRRNLRFPRPAVHQLALIACAALWGLINLNSTELLRNDVRALCYIPIGVFLAFNLLRTPKALQTLVKCIYWSTAAAAVKALYISLTVPTSRLLIDAFQVYNTLNPQFGGKRTILLGADFFFVIALPTAILLWTSGIRAHERAAVAISGLLILFALTVSFTRSNWTVSALLSVSALVYVLRQRKAHLVPILLAIPLIVSAIALLPMLVIPEATFNVSDLVLRRLSTDPSQGNSSLDETNYRVFESYQVIDRIDNSWLQGCGAGCAYFTFVEPGVWAASSWSHNGWLWLIMKFGLIGFAVLSWQVAASVKRVYVIGARTSRSENAYAFFLVLAGIGIALLSLVINRISYAECGLLTGCIIGFAGNLQRRFQCSTPRLEPMSRSPAA
jgi:hypothetical protein